MKPQLVLMRILRQPSTPSVRSRSSAIRDFVQHTGTALWDVNHPFHLGVLEGSGILQTYLLQTTEGGSKAYLYPCVAFQLHLSFEGHGHDSGNKCEETTSIEWSDELHNGLKPIKQPWGSFEFIPNRKSEIIFFQAESSRILFAQLPGGSPRNLIYSEEENASLDRERQDRTKVYCVGRHTSTILSISVRSDGLALASAGRDGCLRIWRLSDGTMIAQTMFSRWRQPRNPRIGLISPLRRQQHEEIECAYPALRVVNFLGKSLDVAMGCPSGEVRTWTEEVNNGLPLTVKKLVESTNLSSGKSSISSLAIHIPDNYFPLQRSSPSDDENKGSYSARLAVYFQEQMAVGTTAGDLHVWTRHKNLGEWSLIWSTSPTAEKASVACLSFRSDGGLLAVATSFSAKQLTSEETEELFASPRVKINRICERLYLYETFSWSSVGCLNFTSQIGTCLFYHPIFTPEDREKPRSSLSREKVSSCRVLLVATSNGPQAHILPEHGLFGYKQVDSLRKEVKTVQWADLKRTKRRQVSQRSSSRSPDRIVRLCATQSRSGHSHQEKLKMTADGFLCSSKSPLARSEARNKSSSCRRLGSKSSIAMHRTYPPSPRKSPTQDIQQNLSLLSLPADGVGLPVEVMMKNHRAGTRQWPAQIKARKCVCCSKHARSRELQSMYPMKQVEVEKLSSSVPKCSSISKQPQKRKPATEQAGNELNTSSKNKSARVIHPCSSLSSTIKKKSKTLSTMEFNFEDEDSFQDEDECDSEEDLKYSGKYTFTQVEERQHNQKKVQTKISTTTHDSQTDLGCDVGSQCKGRGNLNSSGTISLCSDEELQDITTRLHRKRFSPREEELCFTHQHVQTETNGVHDENQHVTAFYQNDHDGPPGSFTRESLSSPLAYGSSKLQATPSLVHPQSVGGDDLPSKHIVGGNDLEHFLTEEGCPLKSVGPAVKEKTTEQKFLQPEPFSTAKLVERLRDLEEETFNLETAFRVAKLKNIHLDEEGERLIRDAFATENLKTQDAEAESKHQDVQQCLRYKDLKQIEDPQRLNPGPFHAARKVKKQLNPKEEDRKTLKPSLSDLWDSTVRCAQVYSTAPNDKIQSFMDVATLFNDFPNNDIHAQWEETRRHAWNSRAIFTNC